MRLPPLVVRAAAGRRLKRLAARSISGLGLRSGAFAGSAVLNAGGLSIAMRRGCGGPMFDLTEPATEATRVACATDARSNARNRVGSPTGVPFHGIRRS